MQPGQGSCCMSPPVDVEDRELVNQEDRDAILTALPYSPHIVWPGTEPLQADTKANSLAQQVPKLRTTCCGTVYACSRCSWLEMEGDEQCHMQEVALPGNVAYQTEATTFANHAEASCHSTSYGLFTLSLQAFTTKTENHCLSQRRWMRSLEDLRSHDPGRPKVKLAERLLRAIISLRVGSAWCPDPLENFQSEQQVFL